MSDVSKKYIKEVEEEENKKGFFARWWDNIEFLFGNLRNLYTYYDQTFENKYAHEKMYYKNYYYFWLGPQIVILVSFWLLGDILGGSLAWGIVLFWNFVNIFGVHISHVIVYKLKNGINEPVEWTILEDGEIRLSGKIEVKGNKLYLRKS